MSEVNPKGTDFDFSHKAVEERLKEGRRAADIVNNKVAPKSGYLDTQLFPGKKDPKAYEENYSFPDSPPKKKRV